MIVKHDIFRLFQKFIKNSLSGKRTSKNGKKLQPKSITNYVCTEKLLKEFCDSSNFDLNIPEIKNSSKRDFTSTKNYWKKFNKEFSTFLYSNKKYLDNYVGSIYKNIRTFFNWVKSEIGINTGDFYKSFYVAKEDIPILTLTCEQFKFLIYNLEFDDKLSESEKINKDILIFGCTCGLRYSDLKALKTYNIERRDGNVFLRTKSLKTAAPTSIKLPLFAITIATKFKCNKGSLLPCISLTNFNKSLKQIFEKAGWTDLVVKLRNRNGKAFKIPNLSNVKNEFRFCDLASSHIMRRTAITTMLTLGMPELIVKKISGHSNDSRSFYRYVNLAQELIDTEVEKVFNKITLNA